MGFRKWDFVKGIILRIIDLLIEYGRKDTGTGGGSPLHPPPNKLLYIIMRLIKIDN
jgi:hypothetical protein